MIAQYLTFTIDQQYTFNCRIGPIVYFGRTHTQGKCQQKLLHFKLVKAMLADQLLFYLERIYDLHLFGQFTDACDAVQVHHTHHLCQHTGEVQIDHQQIATEHTVRYVRILQHTSQTLDHHHTLGHLRG